jgi:hypothetical protein
VVFTQQEGWWVLTDVTISLLIGGTLSAAHFLYEKQQVHLSKIKKKSEKRHFKRE